MQHLPCLKCMIYDNTAFIWRLQMFGFATSKIN